MGLFHGVNVAAVTPHRQDGYEADIASALELVDHFSDSGVSGIALLGATGEFVHMAGEERTRLLSFAVKRSRVPVLAGVGHSSLAGAIRLAEQAAGCGAAGLLVSPPYFYRYRQEELREYFLRFAEALANTLPIFLYNLPFFTNPIEAGTARALLETGAFAGIKDSSGDLEYFRQLQDGAAAGAYSFFVGNDSVFTAARTEGAHGVISGVACAMPELMVGLDAAIRLHLPEKTQRLQARLEEFISWLDRFPVPVGVKEATTLRGFSAGPFAVPLAPERREELEAFRGWFREWIPVVRREALEE